MSHGRAINASEVEASPRGTVLVFARTPELGHVKTRLAATLGDDVALALHTAFLEDTLAAARATGAHVVLARTPGPATVHDDRADEVVIQQGHTFAERFASAMHHVHSTRTAHTPYLIRGVDSPHLGPSSLLAALDLTSRHHAVIGRNVGLDGTEDGFHLLGLTAAPPSFDDLFGQHDENGRLAARLAADGRPPTFTANSYDVDTLDDLRRLHRDIEADRTEWRPPATTAVIAELSPDTLARLR